MRRSCGPAYRLESVFSVSLADDEHASGESPEQEDCVFAEREVSKRDRYHRPEGDAEIHAAERLSS